MSRGCHWLDGALVDEHRRRRPRAPVVSREPVSAGNPGTSVRPWPADVGGARIGRVRSAAAGLAAVAAAAAGTDPAAAGRMSEHPDLVRLAGR